MREEIIKIDRAGMIYPPRNGRPERTALAPTSLAVYEGELVCLLGPSGCGKTTLLNLIAGFFRPTHGRILFRGRGVIGPDPERGVVFQDPTLFPWLNVWKNVEFGLVQKGLGRRERAAVVEEVLDLVGLRGYGREYPHSLSGGQRQRAALARVLVLGPSLILMDEPFSALDALARERLQDELLRIWEIRGQTILFVTHHVEEAAYLADRVVVMGPPLLSLRSICPIGLGRPRDRTSPRFMDMAGELRSELDALPCCVPGVLAENTVIGLKRS